MTWQEALPVVLERTGHGRYWELCDEDNPDTFQRDGYRAHVVYLVTGVMPPLPPPPAPGDVALRSYVAERGCCGQSAAASDDTLPDTRAETT